MEIVVEIIGINSNRFDVLHFELNKFYKKANCSFDEDPYLYMKVPVYDCLDKKTSPGRLIVRIGRRGEIDHFDKSVFKDTKFEEAKGATAKLILKSPQ